MSRNAPESAAGTPGGKARILRAAAELAAEHGVSGVTISEVCRRAAVKPPAIYYHFGSKEGLVGGVLETVAQAWLDQLEAAQPAHGNLAARVQAAVEGWHAMIEDPGLPIPLLISAQLGGAAAASELRAALERVHQHAREVIARSIRAAAGDIAGLEGVADQVHGLVLAAALAFHLEGDRKRLRLRLGRIGGLIEAAVYAPSTDGDSPALASSSAPEE